MASDATPMMSALSLAGSVGSLAATAYLWLVRFNKERPRLEIYPAPIGCKGELAVCRDETRFITFNLSAVIANMSSLPNAVIDLAVDLGHIDGTWQEIEDPYYVTPLPLNLAPMSTTLLTLRWTLPLQRIPEAEELGAAKIVGGYFARLYGEPCPVRVTCVALGGRNFESVVPLESS